MRFLIMLVLLASCGSNDDSNSNKNELVVGSEKSPISETDENLDNNTPKSTIQISLKLATKADLPECLESNQNQLIYISDEGTFYYCENLAWNPIDLKGKDGKDGVNGINGEDGIDGTDGEDSIAQNFVNSENLWIDPISGTYVAIGSQGPQATEICVQGWHHPTNDEGLLFAQRGLKEKLANLGADKLFWVTTAARVVDTTAAPYITAKVATENHTLICIKD